MFAKIAVLCAVVAIAYAGVIASPPASTTLLANTISVAQPIAYANHQIISGPVVRSVVASPVQAATVLSAPVQTIVASPQIIQTGHKIIQTVEPVEQHGYRIAY